MASYCCSSSVENVVHPHTHTHSLPHKRGAVAVTSWFCTSRRVALLRTVHHFKFQSHFKRQTLSERFFSDTYWSSSLSRSRQVSWFFHSVRSPHPHDRVESRYCGTEEGADEASVLLLLVFDGGPPQGCRCRRRQDGLNVPGGNFCCCCVGSQDFLEDDGRALEVSANRCGVFNGSSSCLIIRGSQEANFRNERLQSSRVVFFFSFLFCGG